MIVDQQLLERAREIASRYGGEHVAPVPGEGDILLFGPNSVLLARRERDVYCVSHLLGSPPKERGEERVVVGSPAGSPVTQFVVRRYPDRFKRAGDFWEAEPEA